MIRRFLASRAPLFLGATSLLGSCSQNSEWYGTTTPKHPPDELWVNNSSEPEWIDPGKTSDAIGGTVITNTFEGLLAPDAATMLPTPGVAERWETSPNMLEYTFHLRADAKWSDETPVTAQDFVWSWTRVLDSKTASKYADEMFVIRNGDAFNQHALFVPAPKPGPALTEDGVRKLLLPFGTVDKVRIDAIGAFAWMEKSEEREKALASEAMKKLSTRIADESLLGLEAIDERTFRVTLQDPIPYFLPKITTLYTFYPVPRWVLERLEKEGKNPDLWTRPENFVCNGPFVLTEWKFRQEMVFEKNRHYWDRDSVKLNKVRALMVESSTTSLQMYKAGEVDFSGENVSLPPELLTYLRTRKDFSVSPWLATYWYWVNIEADGVADPRVRHALNKAIDKQALVDHVTRQGQIPATSVIKGGLGGYEQLGGEGYDPESARALLVEAGFPGGKGLPKISILFNTYEGHRALAEAIQEMWRKELGIEVELANQEWSVFLRDLNAKKFQVARLGWIGDYPDPYTFLSVFLSTAGNNRSNWRSKEFDALLAASDAETDPAKRLALMREAEGMVMRDMPVIPLYWYTRSRMVKPYVKGIESNFLDRHPWKAVSIVP